MCVCCAASGVRAQPPAFPGDSGPAVEECSLSPRCELFPYAGDNLLTAPTQQDVAEAQGECPGHYERAQLENESVKSSTIQHCQMGTVYFHAGKTMSPQNQCRRKQPK